MLAPLGTLVFLLSLWLVAVVAAAIFSQGASRILAALRGEPRLEPVATVTIRRPLRGAYSRPQPLRARPQLRAAA